MLISEGYRELNRKLHEVNPGYGTSGQYWAKRVARIAEEEGHASVLDYGCGKGTLKEAIPDVVTAEYDPAVPGKDALPEPADMVVCTDVLEHIEPVHLNALLRDLRRVTKRKLFFNIATRPAIKTLEDGRNAHLLIKSEEWWREKLSRLFHIVEWDVRVGEVFGEAAPRLAPYHEAWKRPTQRRPLKPGILDMFDHIRKQAKHYNDAFTRIEHIRLWEGVDDELADMQCVANLIEDWPDPDECLEEICRLSRQAVMLAITLGDGRTSHDWRKILERRLRIAEWRDMGNQLLVTGAPCVTVQGVMAIGAVSTEERWQQALKSMERCTKRIETAPAHDRRAILACYGPSLGSTLKLLKRERAETGAAVVSVSGAHDFLLKNGIVPDYHIECDPRPHKADNIDQHHPDVKYLLASCTSQALFDKLGPDADIRLWHVSSPDQAIRLIDEMGETSSHVISGGGSVGLRSIPVLYAMGYRDISVYAMDCSYTHDGEKWAGRHFGKKEDACQVLCAGRAFISSPVLLTYATNFWEMVQKAPDVNLRLFGDGLLQWWARDLASEPTIVPPKEDAA